MWRSLVAHLLWEQGVGSSNLPIPTTKAQVRGLMLGQVAGCLCDVASLDVAFRVLATST